eukprot:TRINITY_DN296_c1_g1_i1.p2 TRINITY_DN296_c1_g1~~TRINITY_DN296_c1_g1_i1.p2  ORF type:complete len:190 (+),score=32.91 TRINITY_DN296_c1_g1_i1:1103-1672(+)
MSNKEVVLGEEPIPLQNKWVIWHDSGSTGTNATDYESGIKELCEFDTVQRFWECFNNLVSLDKILQPKHSLHIMVKGCKPLWEDKLNECGGIWIIRIKKEDTAEAWKELVLATIGEQFAETLEQGDEINGVSVSMRYQNNLLQVWNRKNTKESEEKNFNRVKEILSKFELTSPYYKPCKEHAAFEGKKN